MTTAARLPRYNREQVMACFETYRKVRELKYRLVSCMFEEKFVLIVSMS